MNLLEVDDNNYMFFNQEVKELKYKHKFLVPGTETKDLGMDEKPEAVEDSEAETSPDFKTE